VTTDSCRSRALALALAVAASFGQASAAVQVQEEWQRQDGSSASYVVVDHSGNVYVRVAEGTYKYDTDGNSLGLIADAAETAILGPDLVARTSVAGDGSLQVVASTDAGAILWQAQLFRPGATTALVAIAASDFREVYVALASTDPASGAVTPWLALLGADGAVRWSADTLATSAISVNPWGGEVYLTGPAGSARYDRAGGRAWQDANPGNLVRYSGGRIYVVNRKPDFGGYAVDASTYQPDGLIESFGSGFYNYGAQYGQYAAAGVIDPYGNTYVTGQVWPYVWADALTVGFSRLGGLAFAAPMSIYGSDGFQAIALDPLGGIYVAGYTWNSRTYFQAAAKLTAQGVTDWVYVNQTGDGFGRSVFVDQRFNVYTLGNAGGTALLAKCSQWVPFTITAGAGGSISPAGPRIPYGSPVTFTVTPDAGYQVVDLVVDGISRGPLTSFAMVNVVNEHTVSATFARNTYAVTTSAGAGGSVSPAGTSTVSHGDSLTVAITPAAGFLVDKVLVDGVPVGAPASYTFASVTAGHTLQASFKPMLTVTAPNGGETWKRGSSQTIRWTRNGTPGTAVRIELLSGTAVSRVIAASAPIGSTATGSYSWKIPGSQATGGNFRIRITSTSNAAATDVSDAAFSIR